jgi:hypothetical protein
MVSTLNNFVLEGENEREGATVLEGKNGWKKSLMTL